MKTGIFLLLFFQLFTAKIYSQTAILNRNVRLDITEGTIETILKEIAEKADCSFSFSQDIPKDKTVNLSNPKQTIKQFLNELIGIDFYCIEYGNKIIIKKKPLVPENYVIRGRIIDIETKEPIPGVTVFIPDSDPLIGSVSNEEGYFQIVVPSSTNMVSLSCIGYAPEVILSEDNKPVTVELHPNQQELKEVEIFYYTKPKSKSQNSSVSKIESVQIEKSLASNIENSLQGNTSGVHVIRNSGMPGASLQVKIRGVNSLINSEPSYYLDGVYIQKASLYSLSTHDIEKIEIIKDASGTAKYGATAGNGVVLLHSKKVNSKTLSAKLNYYHGIQKVSRTPDLMTLKEYEEFFNNNRPGIIKFDTIMDLVGTNWMDVTFHDAKTEDLHFAISGGNDKSVFYFSSGFYNQEAIIKELRLRRYTFSLNSTHNINRRITIGQNFSFSHIEFKGLKEGCFLNDFRNPILGAMIMPPNDTVGDRSSIGTSPGFTISNPYDDLELSNNIRKNYALRGQVNVLISLLDNLSYSTRFGFETYFQDNTSFTKTNSNSNNMNKNYNGYTYNILDLSYNWRQSINYMVNIKENHSFRLGLDFETGQYKNEWIPVYNKHYVNSLDSTVNATERERYNYSRYRYKSDFSYYAYWASLEYVFKGRYFLNTTVRNEKVSYYDMDLQNKKISDIFPSLSMGWIFTNENFSSLKILSYGKVRFGWGKTGNSPRINYSFFAKMMRDMEYIYAFQSAREITHSYEKRQTNEKFYWESIMSKNVGIDLGLISNRIFLTIDYFSNYQYISNYYPLNKPSALLQIIMDTPGFGIVQLPTARMKNNGVDVELTVKHSTKNSSYNLGLNFSHLKNEIVDVDQAYLSNTIPSDNLDILALNIPGEVAGSFFGYKIERLFTTNDYEPGTKTITNQPYVIKNGVRKYAQSLAKAGDYKFKDINHDGEINYEDKTIIGNPFPDLHSGFLVIYNSIILIYLFFFREAMVIIYLMLPKCIYTTLMVYQTGQQILKTVTTRMGILILPCIATILTMKTVTLEFQIFILRMANFALKKYYAWVYY